VSIVTPTVTPAVPFAGTVREPLKSAGVRSAAGQLLVALLTWIEILVTVIAKAYWFVTVSGSERYPPGNAPLALPAMENFAA
jgi:hypothetical protein